MLWIILLNLDNSKSCNVYCATRETCLSQVLNCPCADLPDALLCVSLRQVNRPIGRVQIFTADLSEIPRCNCKATDEPLGHRLRVHQPHAAIPSATPQCALRGDAARTSALPAPVPRGGNFPQRGHGLRVKTRY